MTDLISLLSKGLSGVFSSTTVWKHQFSRALPSLWSSSHNYTRPPGRPQPYHTDLGWQGNVCFPAHSLFLIAFLPRSNRLLISWLQSPSAVILEPAAAAAAKLRQSCPTLCDPRDSSPPGSPIPGILQGRTLEWAAISFSNT